MAQGLLQKQLTDMAHRLPAPVDVASAGVMAIEGMAATDETLKLLQKEGVDVSGHFARRLSDETIRRADMIFAMEEFHRWDIVRRVPEAEGKTHLLKTYRLPEGPGPSDPNIPDPIGKPLEVYESCFATIREAVERVVASLVSPNPTHGPTP